MQKSFTRKLIISIICIVLLNFCMAPSVQAASFGGKMMKYMRQFATAIADVAATVVQLGLTGKWQYAVDNEGSGVPSGSAYWIKPDEFRYPVLQISPELIFANQIQLLDVNFISDVKDSSEYQVGLEDNTPLKTLRTIIATWYVTLRTIAVVGLLSVLIYLGIRIIISSTSEKAKYKERLVDWVIAFCLLFFMHYIMAATITVVEKVNDMLGSAAGVFEGIEIPNGYGTVEYRSGRIWWDRCCKF